MLEIPRSIPVVASSALLAIAFALPAFADTPLSGATRIATGSLHSCVVTGSGGVQCWGWNNYGQLGDGTFGSNALRISAVASDVRGLDATIVDISAGEAHVCAVTSGGRVKCWGSNDQGVLGYPYPFPYASPTPLEVAGLTNVIAIASGRVHNCALTSAGGVKCWGNNSRGQLGDGGGVSGPAVVDVFGLNSGVVALSAGDLHTCAVTSGGAVKCWGEASPVNSPVPIDIVGLQSGTTAIAAGSNHTCAITGGVVKCFGANDAGQLGDGTTTGSSVPVTVSGLGGGVRAIAAGAGISCAIDAIGTVKCWGLAGYVGDGTRLMRLTPVDALPANAGALSLAAKSYHACALLVGGSARCWGANNYAQLGNGILPYSPSSQTVVGLTGITAVAAGEDHACALTQDASVKCWGRNIAGALGNGTLDDSFTPVDVVGLGPTASIRAGGHSSCAIDGTGGVRCWGMLAGGSSVHAQTPTQVPGLTTSVIDVTMGIGHACALMSSGAVKCWGSNGYGQLGDGTTTDSTAPVDVPGLASGVVAIGAGFFHTCAVLSGGAIKCWGENQSGQVTSVRGGIYSSPVSLSATPAPAFAVALGTHHTCSQTTSFGTQCWGSNTEGQLGQGHMFEGPGVFDVPLPTGTLSLALGARHSCLLGGGGTVRCFGLNEHGQIGVGHTDRVLSPTLVPGISNAAAISARGSHSCAVVNGGVKCWGNNAYGQLGNGVGGYALAPQSVVLATCGGFSDVVAGDPFCANVEWNSNRLITLGCAPGTFCGAQLVSRLAMSAFLNRLGEVLTPGIVSRQHASGALPLTNFTTIVCETAEHAIGTQPMRAYIDGVLAATAAADTSIDVVVAWSIDGLNWLVPLGSFVGAQIGAGRWTNARAMGDVDLPTNATVRYGLMILRAGGAGASLSDSTCNVRARLVNRN